MGEKMSRIFYIADLHFGHRNCISFDNRPFSTIGEHDRALIANWNAVVMPEDHVYVIGDFAYRNEQPISFYTSQLHGHIHPEYRKDEGPLPQHSSGTRILNVCGAHLLEWDEAEIIASRPVL